MRAKSQFNAEPLKRKVNQASFKSLGHAGAAIRLTARRSIRRRKKPSAPGSPPNTPTGHLKRVIRYEADRDRQEVVIGAVNEYSRTIWSLHEFGGSQRSKPRLLKVKTFRVGDFGPVRVKQINEYKTEMVRARLNSEAQAQRATELVREENQRRMADARKRRRYPKRPFMGPALETQKNRLPKFWADSVRG